jgi:hypothetical protein
MEARNNALLYGKTDMDLTGKPWLLMSYRAA